jgi:hypothetical protein
MKKQKPKNILLFIVSYKMQMVSTYSSNVLNVHLQCPIRPLYTYITIKYHNIQKEIDRKRNVRTITNDTYLSKRYIIEAIRGM